MASKLLQGKFVQIFVVVCAYWLVSITTVFMNKWLLSGTQLRAPFFITWYQCVVTVIITYIFSRIPRLSVAFSIPHLDVDKKVMLSVMPLSVVFVGMIGFNNLTLQYVPVSFYYIGRSLTTVFNLILTYYILHEATSFPAVASCVVIVLGFLLGCNQESLTDGLSWLGVIFGVLASLFTCLNAIYTKKILPLVENNIWKLMLYNNLNACLLFVPLMLWFEEHRRIANFVDLWQFQFSLVLFLSAVFGWLMGIVTGLQIQLTSPLTHNISGTAKAAAQTVIDVWWHLQFKPYLWWLSNATVLFGSYMYAHVRRMEMIKKHAGTAAVAGERSASKTRRENAADIDVEKQPLTNDDGADDNDDDDFSVSPQRKSVLIV